MNMFLFLSSSPMFDWMSFTIMSTSLLRSSTSIPPSLKFFANRSSSKSCSQSYSPWTCRCWFLFWFISAVLSDIETDVSKKLYCSMECWWTNLCSYEQVAVHVDDEHDVVHPAGRMIGAKCPTIFCGSSHKAVGVYSQSHKFVVSCCCSKDDHRIHSTTITFCYFYANARDSSAVELGLCIAHA